MANILIVEDEEHLRSVLSMLVVEHGHAVVTAADGRAALAAAAQSAPDLLLLDLMLPDVNGLEVFRQIKSRWADVSCIFMTAYGSIRSAIDAIRAGADDYITKPFDNDELLLAVDRILRVRRLAQEVTELRNELSARYGFDEIVGICPSMREVFRIMSKVAGNDATVLILGESGTGKELVARAIHRRSRRAAGPFVAVNCSAIPSTLIESEFFGFEKGAFTDARETHLGKFEQATRGTLFLDEVGDLPHDAQAKLLRVLQDREITRIGGRKPLRVDVRLLAATNKDLEAGVRSGVFREDLYWRLNVLSLHLPALRERTEDLSLLMDSLLEKLNDELGARVDSIALDARRLLLAHDWPGNVRELENTLRRAIILCEGHAISAKDLPPRIRGESGTESPGPHSDADLTLAEAVRRAAERVERSLIQASLTEHQGNRTAAADSLGINRKTLFNKMKAYSMTADGEGEPD